MGKQDDKDAKWPGFPERLREAFQRAGYWRNDRPDVMRFVPERGMRHGIHVSYCYKYVNGETVPDRKILVALATELGVRPAWLLFGDEEARRPATSHGVKAPQSPLPADTPSSLKENHTKGGVRARKQGTLRKVGHKMAARSLQYHGQTVARGSRRRVA